jgi:hypothetical protein
MKDKTSRFTTCLIFVAPFLPCTGMVAVGRASIVAFNNEVAFRAVAPIVSTETFDEFPFRTALGAGVVVIDDIFYTAGFGGVWNAEDLFAPPPSPPNTLVSTLIEPNTLTFGGSGTQAIGFFLNGGDDSTQIVVTTANGEELSETPWSGIPRPPFSNPNIYRGYVSSDVIISVRVSNAPDPRFGTNWGFDNVSRGIIVPVPELPTGLLLGLGVFVSGCLRRARATKSHSNEAS